MLPVSVMSPVSVISPVSPVAKVVNGDLLKEIDKNMFFLVCDSYEVSEKGDFS